MKREIFILLLLITLAVSLGFADWITANGYVRVDVDETSGEFEVGGDQTGTGDYVKLTYGFPEAPGTEWVMYNVDSTWAKTDESLPDCSSSFMSGDTIICIWDDWEGVYIRQEIVPVTLGLTPGESEQIRFKAVLKPTDGASHNVGCIMFFDTMLDWNDFAPISTAFGYTGIAEIFYALALPSVWRAYENGFPPASADLVSTGILTGYEAVSNPPDIFWYGSWPSSVGNGWDTSEWETDTGGSFGDSAAMVKWFLRAISPGDSAVFVTYYGIGSVDTFLYCSPAPIEFDPVLESLYDSFAKSSIELLVINGWTYDANNVSVSLDLTGCDLVYSGGFPNPVTFSSLAGYGGSQFIDWNITVPSMAFGTEQCYNITIYSDEDTVSEVFCVDIPDFLAVGETDAMPEEFVLNIFPNPFNSSCYISAPEEASIEIYNLRGNVVETRPRVRPIQGQAHGSVHTNDTFIWQPDESTPSGVYLIKATLGDRTIIKRTILMK